MSTEFSHIFLYNGIFIHIGIHGRHENHFGLRGHDGGRKHVVCNTVCHFTDNIGSGRSNDEYISHAGQCNMLHIPFVDIGKHINRHIIAGQFAKGNGGNQLGRIGGHNAVHIGTGLS